MQKVTPEVSCFISFFILYDIGQNNSRPRRNRLIEYGEQVLRNMHKQKTRYCEGVYVSIPDYGSKKKKAKIKFN